MPQRWIHMPPNIAADLERRIRAGDIPSHAARDLGVGARSAWRIARRLRAAGVVISARRSLLPSAAHDSDLVASPPPPAASPSDPVDLRRLRDRVSALSRANEDLARRAAAAQDVRAAVAEGLAAPLAPVAFQAPPRAAPSAETIVLFLSDLHWGEVVDIAALDGLNAFDLSIARARLGRWAHAAAELATRHWTGPAPARVILILGGDLVSGEIHAELAKTNEAKSIAAVRDAVAHLAEAIRLLLSRLPDAIPIDVISLPGNHGRTTLKPESKEAAALSYDTLVCDFLRVVLSDTPRIAFHAPPSGDALFSVYGWRIFATHGDRIGSRGGQGFIGPAATAARGFKRILSDYAARGVLLDLILIGHFHTPLQLEEGFVNGSLPGPTEYARDGRFRPHRARQLFLSLHPRRGVTQVRWIDVGDPSEGSLYDPPAEDRPLRPRYRIPAVTRRSA